MGVDYITYAVTCSEDVRDMLIADLAGIGFEGFVEEDHGFSAYISGADLQESHCIEIFKKYGVTDFKKEVLPNRNWNEEWEKDFEPIVINEEVIIRAPFHKPEKKYTHELVIQPKNTFGTGHHETTRLMIGLMLDEDFKDKEVFDYGSGTGVLGIMAAKLGARSISAIDIDQWSAENIEENLKLNGISNFTFTRGDLSVVPDKTFDIVLANINKNIILRSLERLCSLMHEESHLIISGFYESDLDQIKVPGLAHGLHLHMHETQNGWCAAQFKLFRPPL